MFEKMRRGGAALCTAAVLAVAAFSAPVVAHAAAITHDIGSGGLTLTEEQGACPGHIVTGTTDKNQLVVTGGIHDIILKNVNAEIDSLTNYSAPLVIEAGTANLTLEGANVLVGGVNRPGIRVDEGANLTVAGTGSLKATGGTAIPAGTAGAAGIGGAYNQPSGNITINNGDITATGSGGGAGIGSGYFVGSDTTNGNITITGGRVIAYGGHSGASTGAGIGAGENGNYGGTITISGGLVYAIGGDESMASIGGGGNMSGGGGNGTFTTGKNGNAIIVASAGIGDRSNEASWSGFFLSEGGSVEDVTYDFASGDVTFTKGRVFAYGTPEVDYNIVVDSTATLQLSERTANATELRIQSSKTLTNNNATNGIVLGNGTKLVLEGGVEQCLGSGKLINNGTGVVQLPVSEGLVGVDPARFAYDGTTKEPAVTVRFDRWGYQQAFKAGTDYTVVYANNVEVGTADAKVTAAGSGNLLASENTSHFDIVPADFAMNMPERWTVAKGETALLSKLPAARFAANTPEEVKGGTLAWFSDKDCTTSLADDAVAELGDGSERVVYWKYTQNNGNYSTTKTGAMTLVVSELTVPNASIDLDGSTMGKTVVYGSDPITPQVKLTTAEGEEVALKSEVTWTSSDPEVFVVQDGKVVFTGVGTATLKAEVAAYTDPDTPENSYASVSGSASITVTPKPISVDGNTLVAEGRPYDGTRNVSVSASLEAGSIINDDDATLVVAGTIDSAYAGKKSVDVAYSLTGTEADNYVLSPATTSTTMTITKADPADKGMTPKTGAFTVYNQREHARTFALRNLNPDAISGDGGSLVLGRPTYEVVSSTVDEAYFSLGDLKVSGDRLTANVHAVDSETEGVLGEITIRITSTNFEDMTTTIQVSSVNPPVEPEPEPTLHTITAEAGAGGTIDPAGTITVEDNESVAFVATPDKGYEVADVTVDGVSMGAQTSFSLDNVTADHSVMVTFRAVEEPEPAPQEFVIVASAGEGGSIDPSGEVTVDEGESATFTVAASEGYVVKDVLVDGRKAELSGGMYTFLNVDANHTIAVTFEEAVEPVDPNPGPEPGEPDDGKGDEMPSDAAGGDKGDKDVRPTSGPELPHVGDSTPAALTIGVALGAAALVGVAVALRSRSQE